MAAASSRFRSVCEEDLDSLLVEAVPEKTKVAMKYGMKIFHGKNRSRKFIYYSLKLLKVETYFFKSCISIDTLFVNKFRMVQQKFSSPIEEQSKEKFNRCLQVFLCLCTESEFKVFSLRAILGDIVNNNNFVR